MKMFWALGWTVTAALAVATASADTIYTVDVSRLGGYYGGGGGGEFTLQPLDDSDILDNSAYSVLTRDREGTKDSFQSFCVERDEDVRDSDVVISNTYASGDPGWSHAEYGGLNTNSGDDLDPWTAYLYTEYAHGVLSSYDYSPGAGREGSAYELQRAIWFIEEEYTAAIGNAHDEDTAKAVLGAASQAFAWWQEARDAGWTDLGFVRVLNAWDIGYVGEEGHQRQDLLYLTVPEPGTATLAALGLALAWSRRRGT